MVNKSKVSAANKLDTEDGFVKANQHNLPQVTYGMIENFRYDLRNGMVSAEQRGWRVHEAADENYGDSAVAYPQVKRVGDVISVRARLTPAHRVRDKPYRVYAEIDEDSFTIISAKCQDCSASSCGCKHGVAFLYWLHRRSEEPSVTEVTSYWRKAPLSRVGSDLRHVNCCDFDKHKRKRETDATANCSLAQSEYLEEVAKRRKNDLNFMNNTLFKYFNEPLFQTIDHHHLINNFFQSDLPHTDDEYLKFCSLTMSASECHEATKSTMAQSTESEWFCLRYGRITASILYQAAQCKTVDGSLSEVK